MYRPEELARFASLSQELQKAVGTPSLGKQFRKNMEPLIKNMENLDRVSKSLERFERLQRLDRARPFIFRESAHAPLKVRRTASTEDIAGLRDAVVAQTQVLHGLHEAGQAQAERSDARERQMIWLTGALVLLALVTLVGLFVNGG